jgi:hypothetical protein
MYPSPKLSVHSHRSGFSDKFLGSEDIEMSDGEDEDGIIIDNNDSSDDDESGDNTENGKCIYITYIYNT